MQLKLSPFKLKQCQNTNKQGWKFGLDICERKNNPLLYTILVNLKINEVDYYIYECDILSEKVERAYSNYLKVLKKNGEKRKDIAFRWYDFSLFTEDDHSRKNNWKLLGL